MKTNETHPVTAGCLLIIYLVFTIAWVINLVKLVQCDFEAPYKDEIIHTIGLVDPPTSLVTVWF